jgi:pentatricopeptide repeat protein
MSYRSLCIRAFNIPRDSTYRASKWYSTNSVSPRTNASPALARLDTSNTGSGLQDSEPVSRESKRGGREGLSTEGKLDEPATQLHQSQFLSSIKQTAFQSTYHKGDDGGTLSLPETPPDWGPKENHGEISLLRRRLLLRSAFLEAVSTPSQRRSQIISRAMKSETRLKALDDLLYPYRRRPLRWDANFFKLFKSSHPQRYHIPRLPISKFADEWFQDLYRDSSLTASNKWELLSLQQKQKRWPDIMMRCLVVSPDQALNFLIATHVKPFPPFEVVMDALLYLRRVRGTEITSSADLRSRYIYVLNQQRQPSRWIYHMEQKHLDLLLEECSDDEGKDLVEKLLSADIDLSYHCLLILMGFFTRTGDIDSAVKVLDLMDSQKRLLSDEHLLSRCTNLLKLDYIVYEGDSPNFRILPRILEAGVKPNLPIHNMIMKNAVRLGAHVVAWDLYRYIQDHDLPTDARTYLILMQDALARRDTEGLEEVFSAIDGRKDLFENAHLIACTLNAIRVMHGQHMMLGSDLVFSKMLAVYGRAFSTAPLKHLRMIFETSKLPPSQSHVEPDAATLAFVVLAYVLAQRHPMVVESLFSWVEHLRSKGDDIALALTDCPAFYDGFIRFFAYRSSTLSSCLQIVQLMLDREVEPSATTWSILVSALMKHGQFQAAEELRAVMGRKGFCLEESTTGSSIHHQPPTTPAESNDGSVKSLEELSEQPPSKGQLARTEVGQESGLRRQEVVLATDNTPTSNSLPPSDMPGGRLRSNVDTIGRLVSKPSDHDYMNDRPQSTLGAPQEHSADDNLPHDSPLQSQYAYEDSIVHCPSPSDSVEVADLGQTVQNGRYPPLSIHPPATSSDVLHFQQGEKHLDLSMPPQSTSEPNRADERSSFHDRVVNFQMNSSQGKADFATERTREASDLSFAEGKLGNDDEVDFSDVRDSNWSDQELHTRTIVRKIPNLVITRLKSPGHKIRNKNVQTESALGKKDHEEEVSARTLKQDIVIKARSQQAKKKDTWCNRTTKRRIPILIIRRVKSTGDEFENKKVQNHDANAEALTQNVAKGKGKKGVLASINIAGSTETNDETSIAPSFEQPQPDFWTQKSIPQAERGPPSGPIDLSSELNKKVEKDAGVPPNGEQLTQNSLVCDNDIILRNYEKFHAITKGQTREQFVLTTEKVKAGKEAE